MQQSLLFFVTLQQGVMFLTEMRLRMQQDGLFFMKMQQGRLFFTWKYNKVGCSSWKCNRTSCFSWKCNWVWTVMFYFNLFKQQNVLFFTENAKECVVFHGRWNSVFFSHENATGQVIVNARGWVAFCRDATWRVDLLFMKVGWPLWKRNRSGSLLWKRNSAGCVKM